MNRKKNTREKYYVRPLQAPDKQKKTTPYKLSLVPVCLFTETLVKNVNEMIKEKQTQRTKNKTTPNAQTQCTLFEWARRFFVCVSTLN